jgi:hypothetical protein
MRFATVRHPPVQPKRVLVYDDHLLPRGTVVTEIGKAAAELGLEVELIGRRFGCTIDNPEALLPHYDIVCAMGRKAIEALACGCAVVVLAPSNCGRMLDERNFERLRDADFSADADTPQATADRIRQEFNRYSAASCLALSAKVRSMSDFRSYAAGIDFIYRSAISMHDGYAEDLDAEQQATSAYLRNLSVVIKQVDQVQKMRGDVPISIASLFHQVSAKLASIQTDLDKPQW